MTEFDRKAGALSSPASEGAREMRRGYVPGGKDERNH